MAEVSSPESRRPLAELLPVSSSPDVLERTWRRVEATRARRRRVRQLALGITPALATAAALWLWTTGREELRVGSTPKPELAVTKPSVVHLSATSSFTLGPDDGVTVEAQTPTEVQLALDRGRVHVTVDPAERRRWTVSVRPEPRDGQRCEPVAVEVLGTVFDVERDADAVTVSVDRGVVAVSGPGFSHRVEASRAVTVPLGCTSLPEADAEPPSSPSSVAALAAAPRPPDGPTPTADLGESTSPSVALESPASLTPPTPSEVPRPTAPASNHRRKRPPTRGTAEVVVTPTETAVAAPVDDPPRPPSLSDVMATADAHRRAGEVREAIELLEGLLRERDHEPGAGIVAYTLATLHEGAGDPSAAARAFDRASGLGLPDALRAAAVARAFDAWARAGDSERATRGAADYLARYPTGEAAAAARAVLER
jgi:hypothetical protein